MAFCLATHCICIGSRGIQCYSGFHMYAPSVSFGAQEREATFVITALAALFGTNCIVIAA